MRIIFLSILLFSISTVNGQNGLVGPAYAAQRKAELKQLQKKNATRRAKVRQGKVAPTKPPSGPDYAIANKKWLESVQEQNSGQNYSAVGPMYAYQNKSIKANQRWFNGTWQNNIWYARPRFRNGPYLRTPNFRPLSDPYIWYSQSGSYWYWRY